MLAYYLLATSGETVEYGEALDLLRQELCLTPKVGRSVLKKLKNTGYITISKSKDKIIIKTQPLNQIFISMISDYRTQRCRRVGLT